MSGEPRQPRFPFLTTDKAHVGIRGSREHDFLGARASSPRAVRAGETSSPWHTGATCRTAKGVKSTKAWPLHECARGLEAHAPRRPSTPGSRGNGLRIPRNQISLSRRQAGLSDSLAAYSSPSRRSPDPSSRWCSAMGEPAHRFCQPSGHLRGDASQLPAFFGVQRAPELLDCRACPFRSQPGERPVAEPLRLRPSGSGKPSRRDAREGAAPS